MNCWYDVCDLQVSEVEGVTADFETCGKVLKKMKLFQRWQNQIKSTHHLDCNRSEPINSL